MHGYNGACTVHLGLCVYGMVSLRAETRVLGDAGARVYDLCFSRNLFRVAFRRARALTSAFTRSFTRRRPDTALWPPRSSARPESGPRTAMGRWIAMDPDAHSSPHRTRTLEGPGRRAALTLTGLTCLKWRNQRFSLALHAPCPGQRAACRRPLAEGRARSRPRAAAFVLGPLPAGCR